MLIKKEGESIFVVFRREVILFTFFQECRIFLGTK